MANFSFPFTLIFKCLQEKRERVHYAIRQGTLEEVMSLLADENDTGSGKLLAMGKNSYGRCTLHVAVLCQQEEMVDYIANTFPDTLQIGDNVSFSILISSCAIRERASGVLWDLGKSTRRHLCTAGCSVLGAYVRDTPITVTAVY